MLLVACDKRNNKARSYNTASEVGYSVAEESLTESSNIENDANAEASVKRKLIKTGDISFETDDLSKTRTQIEKSLATFGGYVATENEYSSSQKIHTNLTVRVPSKNFDTFLTEISSDVKRFDTKTISVNDVTEQFLDVEARLKVKKELEERYSAILKKANSVREVLDVEKELTNVRSEIESIEGRLKYLQNQVSYSTLQINFYKTEASKAYTKTFGKRLVDAFGNGIDNIKWFFIGLVNIWPFILLLVLLIIFIRKRIKRKKK